MDGGRVTLDDDDVRAIAVSVAEHLKAQGLVLAPPCPADAPSADAREVAGLLGVKPEWVREHARQLGGVQLGDGPRPRWRFVPDRAVAAYARLTSEGAPAPNAALREGMTGRRRSRAGSGAGLLPIRGREVPRP